jgi:EmrB/QacA subfamily drug resistance transporter
MSVNRQGSDVASTWISTKDYERRWFTLTVLCLSLVVVVVGNTSLNVALPTLARDLGATTSAQQWMVDVYSLVFAGLLFTAGTLGDRYGRKGALQFGLSVFLIGSVLAEVVGTATGIIVGRAVMGMGAAFVMPATLSVLTNVFPPHERGKAIAVWAGIAGAGGAVGPVASGFLLEHFAWGSVFLINVPIIAIALIAGWFLVPTSRDPEPGALDPVGGLLSIAGLSTLVYAIIEAPHHGWASRQSVVTFALALLIVAGFVAWELRCRAPMLDLRYFLDRRFSVSAAGMTFLYFGAYGGFFLMTMYFQLVLGYGALKAGLCQLPFAIVIMAVSPRGPKLAARFGVNRLVGFGLLLVATSSALYMLLGRGTSYWVIVIPIVFQAAGQSLAFPSMTAGIMSAVPLGKAGVGSAMNDTTRELGAALGVAVLGSVAVSRFDSRLTGVLVELPANLRGPARESLANALDAIRRTGTNVGPLVARTQDAFVSGVRVAMVVGGAVLLVGGVFAYRRLPSSLMGSAVATPSSEPPRALAGEPELAGTD